MNKTYEYPDQVYCLEMFGFASVWSEIQPGDDLILERDPANAHDANAVAVYYEKSVLFFFTEKVLVGYLRSQVAEKYAPLMDAGKKFFGRVHTSQAADSEGVPRLKVFVRSY